MLAVLFLGIGLAAEPPPAPVSLTVGTTDSALDAVLRSVVPQVEAAAHAKLLRVPEIRIARRSDLKDSVNRYYDRLAENPNFVGAMLANGRADSLAMVSGAMALYLNVDESIYVIREVLEDLQNGEWSDLRIARPVLRCLIAHELTHALQHQYAGPGGSGGTATLALREGHAQVVMREVCGDTEAMAWLDLMQRSDVVASADPADPNVTAYVYGERLVRAWIDVHGRDAIWWALNAPQPSFDGVRAAVGASVAPGWTDSGRLDPIVEDLSGVEAETLDLNVGASLRALARALSAPGLKLSQLPTASASLVRAGAVDGGHIAVATFVLDHPADGPAWVALRHKQASTGFHSSEGIKPLVDIGATLFSGRVDGVPGAAALYDDSVRVRLVGDRSYAEYWAARGHHLALVVTAGVSRPVRKVREALDALLVGEDRSARGPIAAVDLSKVPELANPPAAVPLRMHVDYAVTRALTLAITQGGAPCVEFGVRVVGEFDTARRDRLSQILVACAVLSADDAWVSRAWAVVPDRSVVDPRLRLGSASLLADAGRPAEALSVLDGMSFAGMNDAEAFTAFALGLAFEVGNPAQVRRWAGDPLLPPEARYYAVAWFLSRDDRRSAAPLLVGLCSKLSGELLVNCRRAEAYVR